MATRSDDSMAWLARRDGSVVVGHGPFEAATVRPASAAAFFIQDFALGDAAPWKVPATHEVLGSRDFAARYAEVPPPVCQWLPLEVVPFSGVFQEVMAAIHCGVFEKTVPVVAEIGGGEQDPGPGIIAAMARQAAPLCSYGWSAGASGFAGATPELLISLDGLRLETMALAGTARLDDREVFAADEKEIREHEYVAQTLVAKLTDLGRLERRTRHILDLGSIVHFLTLIGLDLHQAHSPDTLVKRLHPTPALGPLPRTEETLGLLLAWRERLGCPAEFGAPFGVWHHGRFDAVVAIRGIWWNGGNLTLPAGCGVIEASRLVNEWRELRLKREAVKRFLASS
ncbi:MAG: chorismate-binding protein [Verrucomicrobia bacterium]|nr:chorismate-binding protein [Verrucomicrobiota bacterium]